MSVSNVFVHLIREEDFDKCFRHNILLCDNVSKLKLIHFSRLTTTFSVNEFRDTIVCLNGTPFLYIYNNNSMFAKRIIGLMSFNNYYEFCIISLKSRSSGLQYLLA